MTKSQNESGDLEHVTVDKLRVAHAALNEDGGQCGWHYPGAAGRCTDESDFIGHYSRRRGGHDTVPLCEKHAKEAGANV